MLRPQQLMRPTSLPAINNDIDGLKAILAAAIHMGAVNGQQEGEVMLWLQRLKRPPGRLLSVAGMAGVPKLLSLPGIIGLKGISLGVHACQRSFPIVVARNYHATFKACAFCPGMYA